MELSSLSVTSNMSINYEYYEQQMLKICTTEEITKENGKPPQPKNEDAVVITVGDFGTWQKRLVIMMALLRFPISWYQLDIIFLAPATEFWCKKPEAFSDYSDDKWRQMSVPLVEENPCMIFDPEILRIDPTLSRSLIPLVKCESFEYNLSVFTRTIITEWNLVCDRQWMVNFTQVVLMCGFLIGSIIFGNVADKYGRKTPLMISIVIQTLMSYAASFVPSYWMFLVCRFILALASGGVGIISFVLVIEVVGGKWRTIIPVLYQLPFGLGNPVMTGLAYWLRDWRKLQFALSTLSALFISYWFCISESPRWLLATGNTEEAYAQYLGWIGDNIFLSVMLSGLISSIGPIICVFVIMKMGRKTTLAIFEGLTALCFVFILLIPRDVFTKDWPRLVFAGIGFGGMAGTVPVLYLFSGELYPTLGRNVGVSGVSTFARIGSMVAPMVASLNELHPDLPLYIMAVVLFAQILVLIPLPETKDRPLPDTLEQAEQLGQTQKINISTSTTPILRRQVMK
ncbi:solute carrier family 22 member 6-like isoform X2 [Cydia pomonella]|uniref:solute carrier family 22 member 6-like isoform X2 n=1 Tax=Cydia pomonella TaxID=82600 RepID=UPI002ADDE360|nr:solute carrier family 22 member 6-like isoform X2 [Cydia pomonella]